MRTSRAVAAPIAALAFVLAGCAATEPPAPRDEALYVESVIALGGDLAKNSDESRLIEHGDMICQTARDSDTNIEGARDVLGGVLEAQGTTATQMEYWAAVAAGAGRYLCNEFAE